MSGDLMPSSDSKGNKLIPIGVDVIANDFDVS